MGAIRTIGLIFFMVILIGGCVAAVSAAPPNPPPISQSPQEVSWEVALDYLRSGQVASAAQTHNLRVYLHLVDGTYLVTWEPKLDAIFTEIAACGAACEGLLVSTE